MELIDYQRFWMEYCSVCVNHHSAECDSCMAETLVVSPPRWKRRANVEAGQPVRRETPAQQVKDAVVRHPGSNTIGGAAMTNVVVIDDCHQCSEWGPGDSLGCGTVCLCESNTGKPVPSFYANGNDHSPIPDFCPRLTKRAAQRAEFAPSASANKRRDAIPPNRCEKCVAWTVCRSSGAGVVTGNFHGSEDCLAVQRAVQALVR